MKNRLWETSRGAFGWTRYSETISVGSSLCHLRSSRVVYLFGKRIRVSRYEWSSPAFLTDWVRRQVAA